MTHTPEPTYYEPVPSWPGHSGGEGERRMTAPPTVTALKRANLDAAQTAKTLRYLLSQLDTRQADLLISALTTVPDLDDDTKQQHSLTVIWLEAK